MLLIIPLRANQNEKPKGQQELKMNSTALNFCKRGQMSICTADTIREQGDCSFFEKSQHADRCMYYIFDEYCDCLKAQINAGGSGS
jgi:hypothetical protein